MLIKKFGITLFVFICALTVTDAQNWWKNKIRGEGDVTQRTLDVGSFDGFTLAVSANVELRQGDKHEIIVKAQPNIIDNINLKMDGGHLKITYDRPIWRAKQITIYMTTPNLNKIGVSGSGNVKTDGKFTNLGDLQINVSGSGNVIFACDAKNVSTKISGSGGLNLSGGGSSIKSSISGSGNVKASDFKVADAIVKVTGSGNVSVFATESLDAHVSGSGNVKYKGNPDRLRSKANGSGGIRSMK